MANTYTNHWCAGVWSNPMLFLEGLTPVPAELSQCLTSNCFQLSRHRRLSPGTCTTSLSPQWEANNRFTATGCLCTESPQYEVKFNFKRLKSVFSPKYRKHFLMNVDSALRFCNMSKFISQKHWEITFKRKKKKCEIVSSEKITTKKCWYYFSVLLTRRMFSSQKSQGWTQTFHKAIVD